MEREHEQQDEMRDKSTASQAYFNFLKSVIGIGIIAFPFASNTVGWLWALVLIVPIGISCIVSNTLLIRVADDLNIEKLLYADAAKLTLGWHWPQIINIILVISQIGICIAYLLFLTQSTAISLLSIGIEVPKWIPFALSLFVIIPMSFVSKMHYFHQTSQYGYYFAMLGLTIVACNCYYLIQKGEYSFENKTNYMNSFQFIGVAILICEGAPTILPIRDSMLHKNQFVDVAQLAILTAFLISIVISTLGVITFQYNLDPIVIFNIGHPYLQFMAILLYGTSLMLTYPVQLFPAIQIIENIIKDDKYKQIEEADTRSMNSDIFLTDATSIIIRTVVMIVIYLIAYWVPNFSHFLNFLGSIFGAAIQFLFPVLIHLYHFKDSLSEPPVLTYVLILGVAFLSMTLGAHESIQGLM